MVGGYGAVNILQNCTINVELGEIVVIVGPNGAGKSTIINIMAGLAMEVEAVDEGVVLDLLYKEGDTNIPVNKVIAILGDKNENVKTKKDNSNTKTKKNNIKEEKKETKVEVKKDISIEKVQKDLDSLNDKISIEEIKSKLDECFEKAKKDFL